MNEPYLKMVIFLSLACVWLYFFNVAMVFLVCRHVRTKRALHFFLICHAIISFVGFFFAAKVLEATDQIDSLPKGQRVIIGISLMVISVALPTAISILSVKHFFPDKWKKYWETRNTLWN